MSKSGSSFFALLIGVLTGGILGILYAPDKGVNTRDKLSFQLDRLKKQLEGFLDDVAEGKAVLGNTAKDQGEQIVKDAKTKAEELLDDVNGLISQIKKN